MSEEEKGNRWMSSCGETALQLNNGPVPMSGMRFFRIFPRCIQRGRKLVRRVKRQSGFNHRLLNHRVQ